MEQSNIFRTVNRYWNGATATGDPYPGQSALGYAGQPPQYAGQLGMWAKLNYSDAQKRSDPAASQSLQSGRYQYVQFAASGTAYAVGQILYWSDETTYVVTNVPPTHLTVAGVCLSIVGQGNYWFVQTSGVASVLFAAGLTTPALGETIHANNATPSLAVNSAAVTTPILAGGNAVGLVSYLGVAKTAPVSSTISLIYLKAQVEVE